MLEIRTLLRYALLLAAAILIFSLWNPPLIPLGFGTLTMAFFCFSHGSKPRYYSRWAAWFLACCLLGLSVVSGINYLVDPLWCFPHVNSWNRSQLDFNERQQKTNLVTFRKFYYRSLLLGSSRTVCIDQNYFKNMAVFNYAVNSMVPDEYGTYIHYARTRKGTDFEYIILGLDFFGTNRNLKKDFERPEQYIERSNSFVYRYKMLISSDVLKLSINTLLHKWENTLGTYDRFNVLTPATLSAKGREFVFRSQLARYKSEIYGRNYRYDSRLKDTLRTLKEEYPNTKFIVYTTPVSQPLFNLMLEQGRFADYERWLHDIVDVFGTVYNFMDINSISMNYNITFVDTHHMFPATASMLAQRVYGNSDHEVPADFGKLVTSQNIDQVIASVKARCPQNLVRDNAARDVGR